MQNSGTKLVLALVAMALLLGAVSWWYRYEAAHRASQYWGPAASRLIAEAEGLEVFEFVPGESEQRTDLSQARGQAHLRHALLSDRNYEWQKPAQASKDWHWRLRFHEDKRETLVCLSEDLETIGKPDAETALSCAPMTASLRQYFEALGLVAKPRVAGASSDAE